MLWAHTLVPQPGHISFLSCFLMTPEWPIQRTTKRGLSALPFPLPLFHFFLPAAPYPHPSPGPFLSFLFTPPAPPSLSGFCIFPFFFLPSKPFMLILPGPAGIVFLEVFRKALLQVSGPEDHTHTHLRTHTHVPHPHAHVHRRSAAHPSIASASSLDVT